MPRNVDFKNSGIPSILLLLVCILFLVSSRASAISSTGPTPANPWSVVGQPGSSGATSLYFSSPAEAAAYLIAAWNSGIPSDPVTLIGFPGPDTTDAPCSTTTPCYGIFVQYAHTVDGLNTGIFAVVRNQGSPSQVCPDGSSAPTGQTCVGKSLGDCLCGVADPIDVGSGNVYEHYLDYATSGQNRLEFIRYYNSRQGYSLASELGMLWRSNYDRFIRVASATAVIVERGDGQQLVFSLVNGVWTHDSDVDITLTQSGTGWTLTDHDDTVEAYTTNAAGSAATLKSIRVRNGYTQSLTYNSTAQLESVTDSYNRRLSFTYANSLLESVATPDGTSITYHYTAVANGSNLTSVTFPPRLHPRVPMSTEILLWSTR